MNTQRFLQQVASGEALQAKETLNDILSARAFEALDIKKQEIAQTLYNNGENIEVQDTADSEVEDEELLTQEEFESLSEEDQELYLEALEQLDELSKTTLRNYLKGSRAENQGSLGSAGRMSDKARSLGRTEQDKEDGRYEGAKTAKRKLAAMKEYVEELDELSKSTLGSYVKKRVKQLPKIEVGYQMAPSDRDARMVKKYQSKVNKGIGRAVDRLAKEEVEEFEEFNELSEENKNLYMEMLDSFETQLREIGLLDEEQLDEISTTAAKNYLHKAIPSSSKLNQKSAKPGEKAAEKHNYSYENAPYETKQFNKFSKRRTGIRKAINKLESAHPDNKKHAKVARQAFNSIFSDNYRVGMHEPRMGQSVDKERENIRNAHKTVKAAVNVMHKNAMTK
jgi:hypothetical protein